MKTIAITGAGGQIGYALIFRVLSFFAEKNETINLNLIDLPHVLPSLEGTAMEIYDCGFESLGKLTITADLEVGFKDIDWAFLVGAQPRQKGMERSDLLAKNALIFKEQGAVIDKVAKRSVQVLVVGNPCNTNALIASHYAPSIPKNRFYGMMMLDELRSRGQLALKANVPIESVKNMIVWGNHSATQYPDYTRAMIGDKLATTCIDQAWLANDFIPLIQKRGAAVIAARGASSAASAANAALETMVRIDYPNGEPFSLGIHSSGQYGAEPGLMAAYPCIVKQGQPEIVTDIELSAEAHALVMNSFNELAEERSQLKTLGIID